MRYVPVAPKRVSPLFTNIERWNGSTPVIPAAVISKAKQDVDLSQNPFALMLASQARVDRDSRILKVPRDLLMKFSIVKNPKDRKLWLVPNINDFKSLSSNAYIANKINCIQNKKWQSYVSFEVISNNSNLTTVKDLQFNKNNFKIINEIYIKLITTEINKIKLDREINDDYIKLIDKGSKLFNFNNGIELNLSNVDDQLKVKLLSISKLDCKSDKSLINYLLKYIAYNT